ncbi:MAG: AI-2E family transporter [Nanoarchaeota archaeon]|nr:AI-2E family transporter [Nanoarchaeota archaeon]
MEKHYWKHITPAILLIVLIVLSFLLLKAILFSIITGLLLAFLFAPLFKKLTKKFQRKNLIALSICILFILIIFIPLWFAIPSLLDQSISIYLASQKINFVALLENIFPNLFQVEGFSAEIGSVVYSFVTNLTNSIMNLVSKLILNFPIIFLQSIVAMFTFFFALRDHDKLVKYLQSLLPFSKEVEKKLFKSSRELTSSILYGQVIIGILEGLIIGVGFLIFHVNNALFLTILASIAGIFPIIGTAIVWVPVVVFLLIADNFGAAMGIAAFGIITALMENGLKPYFVSRRTNIHSAIILLGMIGGLFYIGILGVILGPLVLSYLLIILEIYRNKKIPGPFSHIDKKKVN